MSEYLSKTAVLEWLDDRRYKSPWIESFRERLESGAFDIQAAADQDIKIAMTRELTDERVATAAAYWLDASPHERWEPDGIILARYARYAMTEIERLRAELCELEQERNMYKSSSEVFYERLKNGY